MLKKCSNNPILLYLPFLLNSNLMCYQLKPCDMLPHALQFFYLQSPFAVIVLTYTTYSAIYFGFGIRKKWYWFFPSKIICSWAVSFSTEYSQFEWYNSPSFPMFHLVSCSLISSILDIIFEWLCKLSLWMKRWYSPSHTSTSGRPARAASSASFSSGFHLPLLLSLASLCSFFWFCSIQHNSHLSFSWYPSCLVLFVTVYALVLYSSAST